LACVGAFIEAVGQGCVRYGSLERYAVGELSSGSVCKGDDGLGYVMDGKLSCLAAVDNFELPKTILGVAPPSQDGLAIEGDFVTCFVKKYLAAHVAQDGNGEEVVDKARELMC
jgi:hypothetical protein